MHLGTQINYMASTITYEELLEAGLSHTEIPRLASLSPNQILSRNHIARFVNDSWTF